MKPLWTASLFLGAFTLSAAVPLTFEPNRGQAEASAQWVARGTGYYLTLGTTGSRMLLRKGGKNADVRTSLVGANPAASLVGTDALAGHSSYFRGSNAKQWITDLPNFAQVKAQNVYPGIDLVYYGNQSRLEYDFVVAPGADPKRIAMRFEGVSGLRIEANGDLVLQTATGEIVEHKPVVFQTAASGKRPIEGNFRIGAKGTVRFEVGAFDRSLPLTIDPVLVYSSYLGGGDSDAGNALAADGAANMYMTGVTYSTPQGDADVLVRKISADGTAFLYTADLGGSGNDFGNGIAVDGNGSAYIGGRTTSTDFPTANPFQNQNFGVNNAYVVRLNQAGNALVFSTYVGGSQDDRGYGVALDPQGSVYLTGLTTSDDFPTSTGAYQTKRRGGADAFVIKFDYAGNGIYSTFLGGGSDDVANGIAVDANGNAYIAGDTNSDSFPQANAPYQHSRHGGLDGFVSELNPDGSQLVFSTFIGGTGDDSCSGISVDPALNVYVVGTTATDNGFNIPNRSFNTTFNGGSADIFAAKYTAGGQSLAWTTFLGTHGTDEGNAITTDANGNVYIAGDTNSSQYPLTGDAVQAGRGGAFDGVVSVLDTNGLNLLYSTYYGGVGDDIPSAIALDQYYEVYLTGFTGSGDLPISNGAVQSQPGGGDMDAFLAKISVYNSAIPGAHADVNPAPVSFGQTQSSTLSAFGRTMVAPSSAGTFHRNAHAGGAASEPAMFLRRGVSQTAVPTR